MTMPTSFKVGDTAQVRIDAKPAKLHWRDKDTLVIDDTDARKILDVREVGDGLRRFHCTDADGTRGAVNVTVHEAGYVLSLAREKNKRFFKFYDTDPIMVGSYNFKTMKPINLEVIGGEDDHAWVYGYEIR